MLGMTRHIDKNIEFVALINYSSQTQKINVKINENCKYTIVKGELNTIKPFEMTILKVEK